MEVNQYPRNIEFLVKLKALIGESSNKVTSDTDLVNMKLR